jgi:hypothetical protein
VISLAVSADTNADSLLAKNPIESDKYLKFYSEKYKK